MIQRVSVDTSLIAALTTLSLRYGTIIVSVIFHVASISAALSGSVLFLPEKGRTVGLQLYLLNNSW